MTGWRQALLGILCAAVLVLGCSSRAARGAEEPCPLAGDWAFNYEPDISVLTVREDGTAVFQGAGYAWEDDGTFLTLSDGSGLKLSLRYLADGGKVLLYLPKVYNRAKDVPGEGLAGAWIGQESEGSTFIFTEDMRFLEDGTFTGTYQVDPEEGTFLLVYPAYFDETLCYFRLEDTDTLTVEYPWPLVEWKAAP